MTTQTKTSTIDFTTFDTSIAVPDVIPSASAVDRLPFYAMFEAMQTPAIEGKQPHKFIGTSYWVDEREVAPAKATGAYQRAKLREQFKRFKAGKKDTAADAVEARKPLELVLVPRTGKEDIEGIDGPGLSLWVISKAPAAEPKKPAASKK